MAKLTRRISPFALFMLSMNAIIGSGWLFAPLYAAKVAGSAAIISWVIGGIAAILIALTFAELSTMLPVAGGSAHIPQLSHGTFASFIMSWIAWITTLMLAPIEVQAVLQYASLFFPALMKVIDGTPTLTFWGYAWAAILMISLCVINIVSYRGLMRFNFVLCCFKFAVILLTLLAIFHASFNPNNFHGLFATTSSIPGWKSIFTAVATSGIVLAFNGFKSGVEMAGEAKNLSLAIPLSTAGAVFACLILYIALQVCFIGALPSDALQSGWGALNFTGDVGPFVGLAAALGLFWLLKLIYVNAIVSPLGAGLIYVTGTARILYAMSRIGYVPKFLSELNHQRFPVWAIIANFLLGMISFLPLPGWQSMVNFLVSAMVITYAMGPIALICLRKTLPNTARPFHLPGASLFCLISFYCCNLFSYWTGWDTISKLGFVLLIGLALFTVAVWRRTITMTMKELRSGLWVLAYLGGLISISYFGSFGGLNWIPFGWDFLVIGLFSLGILYLAMNSRAEISTEKLTTFLTAEAVAVEN